MKKNTKTKIKIKVLKSNTILIIYYKFFSRYLILNRANKTLDTTTNILKNPKNKIWIVASLSKFLKERNFNLNIIELNNLIKI